MKQGQLKRPLVAEQQVMKLLPYASALQGEMKEVCCKVGNCNKCVLNIKGDCAFMRTKDLTIKLYQLQERHKAERYKEAGIYGY